MDEFISKTTIYCLVDGHPAKVEFLRDIPDLEEACRLTVVALAAQHETSFEDMLDRIVGFVIEFD